jgi:hypothetical protein
VPIPNAENAIVPPEKLRDYLLSPTHPIGRYKARFFATLGYTEANWRHLEADLRAQHLSLEPESMSENAYGRKFLIRGAMSGPSSTRSQLVSVWIIRHGEDAPRFVTAYRGG